LDPNHKEWARAVWNGPGSKDPAIALRECMAVVHTCGGGGWGGPAELLGCSPLPELIPEPVSKSRSVPLDSRLTHGVCLATQGADETPEQCWARIHQKMRSYTISFITDMPIEKMHAMSEEIAALNKPWDNTHPLMVSWIQVQSLPDYSHARTDSFCLLSCLAHFFDPQGLW
jgi:hypothetical protein